MPSDALEWLAVAGLLTIAGVLIKFSRWTFLFVDYGEDLPVLDDEMQDTAGNTVLRVGIIDFAVGLLTSVMNPPSYLAVLVGAVIVLDALRMIYRLKYVNCHRQPKSDTDGLTYGRMSILLACRRVPVPELLSQFN